jgi:hypothetical protein
VVQLTVSKKEQLEFLLHRAWEIEKKFESMSTWEAFMNVGSKYRKTVLTLAKDSHNHRLNLEEILKDLDLEAPREEIDRSEFRFEGKDSMLILQDVAKMDEAARDLYKDLAENTDPKLIAGLSSRKGARFFYQTMNQMVDDENRHVGMVRKLTGHVRRVQL